MIRIFTIILSFTLWTSFASSSANDHLTCSKWLKTVNRPFTNGLIPETQEVNTLIIGYDRGFHHETLLELAHKMDPNTNIILAVIDNSSSIKDPAIFKKFKEIKNLTMVKMQDYQGSVWARDWVPQPVIRNDGSIEYVNLTYYATDNNHLAATQFAKAFDLPHYESWVVGEMGNIMVDGSGRLFTTEKIILENIDKKKNITKNDVIKELKKAFGVNEVHIIPDHPRDGGISHIDLVAKYMGEINGQRTVVVSDSKVPIVKKALDKAANIFESLDYRVVRIEEFEEKVGQGAAGFVNSLIFNKKVFMPTYSQGLENSSKRMLDLERKAKRAYESLGYEVIKVDASEPIKGMGAIHCLTCTVKLK